MRTYRSQRGFTLVEILIVVIILGILAAVVIPQFTSASEDARKNSLTSQVQTLRSQIELYKLQHRDQLPSLVGGNVAGTDTANWNSFTMKTDESGNIDTAGTGDPLIFRFGPYMQQVPKNPLNGLSNVVGVTSDVSPGDTVGQCGFVFNTVNGKLWATDKSGTLIVNDRGEVPPSGS